jgi:hypothetical protein
MLLPQLGFDAGLKLPALPQLPDWTLLLLNHAGRLPAGKLEAD